MESVVVVSMLGATLRVVRAFHPIRKKMT